MCACVGQGKGRAAYPRRLRAGGGAVTWARWPRDTRCSQLRVMWVGPVPGRIELRGFRRPQLNSVHSAQDARRGGRFAGPSAPAHQLPHPAGPEAAQVACGAGAAGVEPAGAGSGRGGRGLGAGAGPATRAPTPLSAGRICGCARAAFWTQRSSSLRSGS